MSNPNLTHTNSSSSLREQQGGSMAYDEDAISTTGPPPSVSFSSSSSVSQIPIRKSKVSICSCLNRKKNSSASTREGFVRKGSCCGRRLLMILAVSGFLLFFMMLILLSKLKHSTVIENKALITTLNHQSGLSRSLVNTPKSGLHECQTPLGTPLKNTKISILVTTSLRESDFNYIRNQAFDKSVSIEWIVFKTKGQAVIPTHLRSVQKQVVEVENLKHELELLTTGLKKSSGDYIFFLPHSVTILQPELTSYEIFDIKLKLLKCNTDAAVMGSLSVYPIDIYTQLPTYNTDVKRESDVSFNIYSMSYRLSKRDDNIPAPFHHKRGRNYFALPKTSKTYQYSFCTGLAGSFIKKSEFKEIRLDDFGGRDLNELQLCLELFKKEKKVIFNHDATYNDFSVIVPYSVPKVEAKEETSQDSFAFFNSLKNKNKKQPEKTEAVNKFEKPPKTASKFIPFNSYSKGQRKGFLKKYKDTMKEVMNINSQSRPNNQTNLSVVWDFGAGSCSGWFIETMEFVTDLDIESRVPNLRIITGREDMCLGLESFKFEAMDRLISKTYVSPMIDIFISHKPPERYPKQHPYKGLVHLEGIPRYKIGRSMAETEILSEVWIHNLKYVDELWLPSSFLVDPLINTYGVDPDKIFVVPEPVDIEFYSPNYSKYLSVSQVKKIVKQLDYRPNHYHFFSVFKYEERKGPEYLLNAYFSEFAKVKDVTLHIQTYIFMHPNGRDEEVVEMEIDKVRQAFLMKHPELTKDDLPFVNIMSHVIPTTVMPQLYHLMDCFVLATRGEGYGLPFAEAMSMGLPTIGTRYGGQLEFMNDNNSYLIDIEKRKPDQEFVIPKVRHLRHLLRQVYANRKESKKMGRNARIWVENNISHNAVNQQLVEHLKRIDKKLKNQSEKKQKHKRHALPKEQH
ncbi:predicted protein [Naegleria gruberi]|uniref:Predicted protein n=1 Tax=Naegleria gruberi TaxID=5762 RepID=D2VTW2_NAEGR|nr:uncharacterized protein NAEGRDRAFT_52212 [Naegleria gruberi]EFC39792.1 predicted protein [Naegleria gruberi]|eukprot:XP_002672536.1 predicted protein [Naegleria gruberi strain NEG-M]